jgi:hypothetical protein
MGNDTEWRNLSVGDSQAFSRYMGGNEVVVAHNSGRRGIATRLGIAEPLIFPESPRYISYIRLLSPEEGNEKFETHGRPEDLRYLEQMCRPEIFEGLEDPEISGRISRLIYELRRIVNHHAG